MTTLVHPYGESHLAHKIPAYDGRKSIYTTMALPFESKEFVVNLNDKKAEGSSRKERHIKVAFDVSRQSQCGINFWSSPQSGIYGYEPIWGQVAIFQNSLPSLGDRCCWRRCIGERLLFVI